MGRRLRLVAGPAIGMLALLIAAVPAWGAFPGRPGPIAYQKVFTGETEAEYAGGLVAHPPRLGRSPQPLTEEPTDASPSYSADGQLIAFESKRHTAGEKARQPHLRHAQRQQRNQAADQRGRLLRLRPVVLAEREAGRLRAVSAVDVGPSTSSGSGSTAAGCGSSPAADPVDTEPAYSPNGKWIAFVSDRNPKSPGDSSNIFSMRPNGGHVRLLVGGRLKEFDPDVSPDGRRIAFASSRHQPGGANVFVAQIGRRNRVRQLTRSNGTCSEDRCYTDPSWAPDGRHLALWRKTQVHLCGRRGPRQRPRRRAGIRRGHEQGRLLRLPRPPWLGSEPALSPGSRSERQVAGVAGRPFRWVSKKATMRRPAGVFFGLPKVRSRAP